MRGTSYFLYAQSIINRLVSKAFLLTFSRHPGDEAEPAQVFGKLHSDDLKILHYLSEVITRHVTGTSPTVLRFGYTASNTFKI